MAASSKQKYLDPRVLNRLGNMDLVARCCVQGFFSGLHPSPFHGFSVEYSDHRQYERGDDLRFLDWKAYARSDKLYIKRFLQETNVPVHILLDTSNSMTFSGNAEYSKLSYGCFLSAALAYLMLGQGDSVGLTLFVDSIHTKIPARSRLTHLHAILKALQRCEGNGQTDLGSVLHTFAETTPRRGIVLLISDLLDDREETQRALSHLKFLEHDVLLFHTLDHMELALPYDGLVQFEDLESDQRVQVYPKAIRESYVERVAAYLADIEKETGRTGIDYSRLDTSKPLDRALFAYLGKRKRMRK
jgi:uncharacterized protein (DUF58 family)